MIESIQQFIDDSTEGVVKSAIIAVIVLLTYVSIRLFRRYVRATSAKHHFHEQRTDGIKKLGQGLIYLISLAIISNVLGFGIQGVFVATSSFFAIVGIAFFATWSILSNLTASILLYFTFPYRIGDRLVVENEPKFSGVLKDVTLTNLKIKTDGGSYITLPANVAIQKIITVQSEADYQKMLAEQEEKNDAKNA